MKKLDFWNKALKTVKLEQQLTHCPKCGSQKITNGIQRLVSRKVGDKNKHFDIIECTCDKCKEEFTEEFELDW